MIWETEYTAKWMEVAFAEAEKALDEDEVPVGAVIIRDGRIIGRGHNMINRMTDPTAHAEIIALTAACQTVGDVRLDGADIFVTLEPCSMCAGALVLARVKRLFYGATDPRTGACGSVFDIVREPRLNHQIEVYGELFADRAAELLETFFQKHR